MTTQATGRGTAGRWAAWLEAASVYLDRRVIAILFLGFSSGLPIMLVATTLSTWLAEEGVSKSTIGLFGFVFVPYTIKFIWAPLIDRMPLPPFTTLLGRRRGWMLFTQLCLVGAIWGLGRTEPGVDLWWTAAMAVTVAFFSASQDVVIDAFRIDSLPKEELGAGAANVVLGYRLAMWVATAGALLAAEWYGWSAAYAAMALLMPVAMQLACQSWASASGLRSGASRMAGPTRLSGSGPKKSPPCAGPKPGRRPTCWAWNTTVWNSETWKSNARTQQNSVFPNCSGEPAPTS